jgi:integrase/recombinase XerD
MKTQSTMADPQCPRMARSVFGDYAVHFRHYLSEKLFAEATIKLNLRYVGKLDEMMTAEGRSLDELDEALAEALILKADLKQSRPTYATFIVKRFARFLAEQGAGKPMPPLSAKEAARTALRVDYETYLRRQRGVSESTVYHSWRVADRFLAFRFGLRWGICPASRHVTS